MDLEYPPELHERDDDYPVAPEVMTIEPVIIGEKQHNLRLVFCRRVPVQLETHLLLPCEETLRGVRSAAPLLPRSRNEAGITAQSDPLQIFAICCKLQCKQHRETPAI